VRGISIVQRTPSLVSYGSVQSIFVPVGADRMCVEVVLVGIVSVSAGRGSDSVVAGSLSAHCVDHLLVLEVAIEVLFKVADVVRSVGGVILRGVEEVGFEAVLLVWVIVEVLRLKVQVVLQEHFWTVSKLRHWREYWPLRL